MEPRAARGAQVRAARDAQVRRDEGSPPTQEQQVVWSKSQLDVMRALLRIYHRSQVPGILYAVCKHIDYDPVALSPNS